MKLSKLKLLGLNKLEEQLKRISLIVDIDELEVKNIVPDIIKNKSATNEILSYAIMDYLLMNNETLEAIIKLTLIDYILGIKSDLFLDLEKKIFNCNFTIDTFTYNFGGISFVSEGNSTGWQLSDTRDLKIYKNGVQIDEIDSSRCGECRGTVTLINWIINNIQTKEKGVGLTNTMYVGFNDTLYKCNKDYSLDLKRLEFLRCILKISEHDTKKDSVAHIVTMSIGLAKKLEFMENKSLKINNNYIRILINDIDEAILNKDKERIKAIAEDMLNTLRVELREK